MAIHTAAAHDQPPCSFAATDRKLASAASRLSTTSAATSAGGGSRSGSSSELSLSQKMSRLSLSRAFRAVSGKIIGGFPIRLAYNFEARRAKEAAGDGAFGRSSQTCCGRCGGRRDVAQCGGQTFWGEYSQRRTLGLSFQRHRRISPAPTGGDQRSHRIEAHGHYLLGLIRRQPDITLLEIQGRLIANCGEHFSSP